jgi:hypothetical protein
MKKALEVYENQSLFAGKIKPTDKQIEPLVITKLH